MARRERVRRSRLTSVVLVLASFTLLSLDFRGPEDLFTGVRAAMTDALAPVRNAGEAAFRPLRDTVDGVTGYDELRAENDALRQRLDELEGERLRARDAAAELQALLEAEGLRHFTDLPTVTARVVGAPISNFEQTIQLDRGADDGIARNMPVATGAGLVGRVVEVSASRSAVRLVTDAASAVGVRVSSSGDLAVAEGAGPDRPLELDLLERGLPAVPGELVVTSGTAGSFYPPGIPVGVITDVAEETATVEPAVALERLRFVQVIQTETA